MTSWSFTKLILQGAVVEVLSSQIAGRMQLNPVILSGALLEKFGLKD